MCVRTLDIVELDGGCYGAISFTPTGCHANASKHRVRWVTPVKPQPLTLDALNALCRSMAHMHHVVQWGGSHVWKVGGEKGKIFVVCSFAADGGLQIIFKCSPLNYDLLKDQPGLRPAPYLASRGMSWIQRITDASMNDDALADYLRESHRLAALNLPKTVQRQLLLIRSTQPRPWLEPRPFDGAKPNDIATASPHSHVKSALDQGT